MNEHILHDYQHYLTSFWIIIVLVVLVAVLMFVRFGRKTSVPQQVFLNASVPSKSETEHGVKGLGNSRDAHADIEDHDTVFIVPDISHYTKFIAGNHFSITRSQKIIFSLINAMIEASTDTFEMSKFEGDAVLLFADARKHSADKIGQTVIAVFDAFSKKKDIKWTRSTVVARPAAILTILI